jgi:hypothetical protein
MKHRVTISALFLSGMLAASGIIAACGGGEAQPTTPANPPPTETADAGAAPAASASAAPVAEAADAAPPAPAASATAAAPSGPPGAPGPGEWDSWSHDQKLEYMKSTIMPKAAAMFHDFDAKKYADAKCNLCHGAGAKTGTFKMPNPALPKLDLSEAGFKALKDKHPKVLEFMINVVHENASLLGEQPYDPATQKGFGCMECHTPKGGGAKAAAKTDKAEKSDKADKKQ